MKIREEKGYALVLSLLIITIFMVVALSLLAASYNNSKQSIKVEKITWQWLLPRWVFRTIKHRYSMPWKKRGMLCLLRSLRTKMPG